MDRFLVLPTLVLAALVVTLTAVAALAIDLPEAPPNYAWREVPAIKGAFLVPSGWHYREERDGAKHTLFITKEPSAKFETGVSVDVVLGSTGPERLNQFMQEAASDHNAEVSRGSIGSFEALLSQYDFGSKRTFKMGVMNATTGSSYLITFESPVAAWEQNWATAQPVIQALALDPDL